ncbi:MAG TPA: STAS domain-containing protein [Rubrivivax sp.]|nr:STAS domain-containing protein [Rubrivivax sp.]
MKVYALPAEASLAQARALETEIDAAVAAADATGLCIDASALADFDTSAIALLLHARRAAAARAVPLALRSLPVKLRELARLYGVQSLLPVQRDGDADITASGQVPAGPA